MNIFFRICGLLICGIFSLQSQAGAPLIPKITPDSVESLENGPAPGIEKLPFDSVAYFYSQTITDEELETHLKILASDEFLGRETAREGQQKAAAYIANYFRETGIAPVFKAKGNKGYFQEFGVVEQKWGDTWFELGAHRFDFLRDFYAYMNSNESLDLQTDELLFLGYGIDTTFYSDYDGMDVNGKIAVIFSGEPSKDGISLISNEEQSSEWSTNWRKKLRCAKQKGIRMLLIVNDNTDARLDSKNFVNYMNSSSMDLAGEKKENPFANNVYVSPSMLDSILGKKAAKLRAQMRKAKSKGKPMSTSWDISCKVHIEKQRNELVSDNVLAYFPGSDAELSKELIIATAHYDHLGFNDKGVYNGADDDGSGTVALLEIAEALELAKLNGHGPRRSVLVMAVSGEEKGLLGSEYYTDHPVFALENTVSDLNVDMIGRVDKAHVQDSDYVYIIGSNMLSHQLHHLSEQVAATYSDLSLDYKYNSEDDPNRYYYRSDHYNFAKNNIPVIFYFNGTHTDYHRQSDTVDKIVFPLLEKRTKLMFFTLWELANRQDRIVPDVN